MLKTFLSIALLAPIRDSVFYFFQGAFSGLLTGMVLGLIRMVLDFIYPQPRCDQPDSRPAVVKYVHYLYFSMILGVVTLIVVVVISLLTEPPPEEKVRNFNRNGQVIVVLQRLACTRSQMQSLASRFKRFSSGKWSERPWKAAASGSRQYWPTCPTWCKAASYVPIRPENPLLMTKRIYSLQGKAVAEWEEQTLCMQQLSGLIPGIAGYKDAQVVCDVKDVTLENHCQVEMTRLT